MKGSVLRKSILNGLVALVALFAIAPGARCELSSVMPPAAAGASIPSVIVFSVIGDDPIPFGSSWHVVHSGGPNPLILNPSGETNGDGEPSLIADPASGLILVAWARHTSSGFDVVASRFVDGAWTEPQVVAGSQTANERDPTLVLGPDGSAHLFYWIDGAAPAVYYTHASADFTSWTAPMLVSEPGQPACRPAGVFHNGTLQVAYEVHDFGFENAPREVVLSRLDGTGFTPEVVALTNNLGNVVPIVHSQSGKLWVDWIDAENGGSGEIAWTRVDAQGHWDPMQFEPFATPEAREYCVRPGVRLKALR